MKKLNDERRSPAGDKKNGLSAFTPIFTIHRGLEKTQTQSFPQTETNSNVSGSTVPDVLSEQEEEHDQGFKTIRNLSQSQLKRVGASSKVNFSKLTKEEKYLRCQSQAYEIKQLRRKVRNLEKKLKEQGQVSYNTPPQAQQTLQEQCVLQQQQNGNAMLYDSSNGMLPGLYTAGAPLPLPQNQSVQSEFDVHIATGHLINYLLSFIADKQFY
jgi:hypothetical protein